MRWIVIIVLILCCIGAYLWLDSQDKLGIFQSPEALQSYIDSFDAKAPIIFMTIQLIQVIISPIPGNITTLAGGALFGFWPSFFYSSFSVILGSICAFVIARYFGRPFVVGFIGDKATDKYLTVLSAKGKVMLAAMFLMPFFPDDIICFVAGISGVSLLFFTVTVIATRPWGLLFSALIGSGVLTLTIGWWIAIVSISLLLFYISFHYADRIESFFIHCFHKHLNPKTHI
jgi:uncharacterized membrane protein YdjX (TVP38/TMEM64 family)